MHRSALSFDHDAPHGTVTARLQELRRSAHEDS
jgi:hypothetical protein